MICTSCGRPVAPDHAFCTGCGATVRPAPAPTPAWGAFPTGPVGTPETYQLPPFPGYPVPSRASRAGSWVAAAVAATVVLVGAAGGTYLFLNRGTTTASAAASPVAPSTGGSGSSDQPPAGTASAAATAAAGTVDALLDHSTQGRSQLVDTIEGLRECRLGGAEAKASFDQVAANRKTLIDSLGSAPFEDLPSGGSLRAMLAEAWGYSLQADQAFAAWAEDASWSGTCGTDDASYRAAQSASTQAQASKKAFLAAWNTTVAGPYGLQTRTSDRI